MNHRTLEGMPARHFDGYGPIHVLNPVKELGYLYNASAQRLMVSQSFPILNHVVKVYYADTLPVSNDELTDVLAVPYQVSHVQAQSGVELFGERCGQLSRYIRKILDAYSFARDSSDDFVQARLCPSKGTLYRSRAADGDV